MPGINKAGQTPDTQLDANVAKKKVVNKARDKFQGYSVSTHNENTHSVKHGQKTYKTKPLKAYSIAQLKLTPQELKNNRIDKNDRSLPFTTIIMTGPR